MEWAWSRVEWGVLEWSGDGVGVGCCGVGMEWLWGEVIWRGLACNGMGVEWTRMGMEWVGLRGGVLDLSKFEWGSIVDDRSPNFLVSHQ